MVKTADVRKLQAEIQEALEAVQAAESKKEEVSWKGVGYLGSQQLEV